MSKSSLATESYPAYSGNYTIGRSGRKIEAITIHHMAGKLTAKQCGGIFQAIGRNGSSHYGIGYNGEIASYVDENNTAWTNSNWDSNCKSVTIETANDENGGNWHVSDKSINSLIKLVADIAKRNNLGTLVKGKNVTWHSMFTSTNCPGPYLMSKFDYIIAEANKINSKTTSKTKYLNISPSADYRTVYKNTNLIPSNAIAKLNPKKYGGLSYKILGEYSNQVVKIKTSMFGEVYISAKAKYYGSIDDKPKYKNGNY